FGRHHFIRAARGRFLHLARDRQRQSRRRRRPKKSCARDQRDFAAETGARRASRSGENPKRSAIDRDQGKSVTRRGGGGGRKRAHDSAKSGGRNFLTARISAGTKRFARSENGAAHARLPTTCRSCRT